MKLLVGRFNARVGAGGPIPAGADAGHIEACNARIQPLTLSRMTSLIVRNAIYLINVHFTGEIVNRLLLRRVRAPTVSFLVW